MMGTIMSVLKPLAYLSLPILTIRYFSKQSPTVRYYSRVALYLSALGAVSAFSVCMSVVLVLSGKRFDIDYWTARTFHFVAGPLLGIRFEIEGKEHLNVRPAVLLGNHQSMLDIMYLGPIFPRATVITAKKELRWAPFLGLFMIAGGNIFLDRRNPQAAIASLSEAGETMKKRMTSLWIFPEGTRTSSEEPNMRPFKKGAFHLAVQSGLPIVPVVCENYWRLYRQGVFGEGVLKIKVLPPIETTGLTAADVPDLAVRTRELMLNALKEISIPVRPSSSSGSHSQQRRSEKDATLMPPPPVPSPTEKPTGTAEARPTRQDTRNEDPLDPEESTRRRTTSLVRSIASSEDNGSQETEEEDGHVLVRRPGA